MPLNPQDSSSPGGTEAGRAGALKTASRLAGGTGVFSRERSRGLGVQRVVTTNTTNPRGDRDSRTRRGLRSSETPGVSDSAKKLLSNGDFAKDFARQAKEISTRRGLTRSQRKAQTAALKTRLAVKGGKLTGDAAEQALDLSRTSLERGLTSAQRVGLSSASEQLLKGAAAENAPGKASDFEASLLKFFDI